MKVAILECARCGTTRSDVRSAKDGAVLWRSYDYSEGYQVPDKADRPTRATYTLAMLNEQGSMNEEAAVPIVKMMKGRRS